MAYSDLANNQGVSFNSLNSGVSQGYFTAITSIPFTTEQVTKSDCITYVNIDPTYLPFAEKANNQIIVKRDLRANEAAISISNFFFTGTITDVTVNGVSITGASFPLDVGNSTTGYTTQLGTYDILVYYADADMPSNYMRIQDSAYNNLCIDGFSSLGPGPYYVYFSSQVVNTSIGVIIESGDGSCIGPIPPPLFSSSPINTVAVSRGTGQYMLVGSSQFLSSGYQAGGLYVSSNYGSSWTFIRVVGYWYKVAISDDGSHMLAVEQYGKAYRSTNYGASWSEITSLGVNPYRGAAINGNGSQMLITINSMSADSIVKKSTDNGVSWTTVLTGNYYDDYNSCAIDSSGSNFYVGGSAGSPYVYRSTNQGSSWFIVYSTSNLSAFVSDVNCTADGSKLVAPTFGTYNGLLKSSDYGSNWVTSGTTGSWRSASVNNDIPVPLTIPTAYVVSEGVGYLQKSEGTSAHTNTSAGVREWRAVSNSNSGQYILAGAYNGLYLSTNYGSSFTSL
jgi:hypothetical protein